MPTVNKWTGERLETDVFTEASIEHLHRYAIVKDYVTDKTVLDIACGEGYGTALIAENAKQVTGIDIDAGVISQAKEKYLSEQLRFLTGNIENIPAIDNQFDVVVSFETLEHTAEHEKSIAEIKRVMKTDGLLIISTPDKNNYSDKTGTINPFHVKELYPEEFTDLLYRYFKNVQLLRQQITFSSIITSANSDQWKLYEGHYKEIKAGITGNALYMIALASDEALLPVNNSLFSGRSIFEQAVLAKEKLVTGTVTYKLGNAILYPVKQIRKLFKK